MNAMFPDEDYPSAFRFPAFGLFPLLDSAAELQLLIILPYGTSRRNKHTNTHHAAAASWSILQKRSESTEVRQQCVCVGSNHVTGHEFFLTGHAKILVLSLTHNSVHSVLSEVCRSEMFSLS